MSPRERHSATACELARELVKARKVVEAAREYVDIGFDMADEGAPLRAALDAYDAATGGRGRFTSTRKVVTS